MIKGKGSGSAGKGTPAINHTHGVGKREGDCSGHPGLSSTPTITCAGE